MSIKYSNFKALLCVELSILCTESNNLAILIKETEDLDDYKTSLDLNHIKELYHQAPKGITKSVMLVAIHLYYGKVEWPTQTREDNLILRYLEGEYSIAELYEIHFSKYSYKDRGRNLSLTFQLAMGLENNSVFQGFTEDLDESSYGFLEVYPKYRMQLAQMLPIMYNEECINLMRDIIATTDLPTPGWLESAIKTTGYEELWKE